MSDRDYIDQCIRRRAHHESFREGDRVTHRVFGDGTVVAIDAEKGAYVIHFDELATNRSIAFRAKLQKIG